VEKFIVLLETLVTPKALDFADEALQRGRDDSCNEYRSG
jgi:hypothetical protein